MAQPRKKAHELIAERLESQKTGEAESTNETPEGNELDKPAVQERIMHPDGTPVPLSYAPIVVYPFAMRDKRRAGGFLAQVFADAIGGGARSKDELELRIASLLNRREDLERELFRLSAVACFKPGSFKYDEDQVAKTLPLIAEFQAKCTIKDVFILFSALSDLAEFQAPKA